MAATGTPTFAAEETVSFSFVAPIVLPPFCRTSIPTPVTIGATIVHCLDEEDGSDDTHIKFWAEDLDGKPLTDLRAWSGRNVVENDGDAASMTDNTFSTAKELARYLTSLGGDESAGIPAPRAVPSSEGGNIVVIFTVPSSGFFGRRTFVVTLEPMSMRGAVRKTALTSRALARKYDAMVGGPSCEFRFSSSLSSNAAVHFSNTETAFSVKHPIHPGILSRWYETEKDYALAVRQAILDHAIEPWRTKMIMFILDGEGEGEDGGHNLPFLPPLPLSIMALARSSAPTTVFIPICASGETRCEVVFETRAGGPLPFIGMVPNAESSPNDKEDMKGVWINGESGVRHPASSPFDALCSARKGRNIAGGADGGCTLYKVELRLPGTGDGEGAVRFSVNYAKTEWFSLLPQRQTWSICLVPNWNSRVELLGHLCRYTQRPPVVANY